MSLHIAIYIYIHFACGIILWIYKLLIYSSLDWHLDGFQIFYYKMLLWISSYMSSTAYVQEFHLVKYLTV